MLGWVVGGVGTFVVSLIFACMFLQMRCRGVGPPFGPHARPWGIFIAVATALVSAGFGLLILAASHELRPPPRWPDSSCPAGSGLPACPRRATGSGPAG